MGKRTIFLTRASLPSFEEYTKEIASLWDDNWITTFGPKHNDLECKLKEYLCCECLSLFSNGHCALEMALQALNTKGEIITTPYTFASTTNAIVRSGYTPVFCDIEPYTYNMDPSKIENLITEKTCAILPVHIYGSVCDVEKINEIAKKHKLKVVYDAAHAFGVKYKGKSISSFGDAVVFSFHASKAYNTAEGGAVCYGDSEFGKRLKCIRNFGLDNDDDLFSAGNGKMSEFSAALGLCNLRYFESNVEKRKAISYLYYENLKDISDLSFRQDQKDVQYNYAYFPIEVANQSMRDDIYDYLCANNIFCQKHFSVPTNSFSCNRMKYKGETPIAEEISKKILLLPLYPDLEDDQVNYICSLIHEIV